MHDVIIVGGGPVGLYLAGLLQEKLDVVVLDKNQVYGRKADSGLYSSHLEEFIPLQKEWIEHEVVGARLHPPTGEPITVTKSRAAAHVVDREAFTVWLASQVKQAHLNTKVESIEITDQVTVKTNKGTFEGKLLVGADGASSIVRKHLGVKPEVILNGIIAITDEQNRDTHVDLYFDKNYITDGFFWKIPRGQSTEYGALGTKVNYQTLERFFIIKKYEKRAAFMNLGYFPTAFERVILIGEAAGQVKPWSLGGIIFGFTAATLAQKVLFKAFEKQDFSQKMLEEYDRAWKKKFGKSIRLGMRFRKQFIEMDNTTLEKWFHLFRTLPFLSKLDMDFPKLELFG